jgi:hypothetical protein
VGEGAVVGSSNASAEVEFPVGMPRYRVNEASLDEGILSLCLPILVCMENTYKKTNESEE